MTFVCVTMAKEFYQKGLIPYQKNSRYFL